MIRIKDFQANFEHVLEKVQAGETILITKNGKPIAQICPVAKNGENARKALKQIAKTAVIGDIVSPIDESWNAMK